MKCHGFNYNSLSSCLERKNSLDMFNLASKADKIYVNCNIFKAKYSFLEAAQFLSSQFRLNSNLKLNQPVIKVFERI